MKNKIQIPKIKQLLMTLLITFSIQSFAEQNVFHFLNYDQFISLTDSEQKTYIKEIQILNLNLTENAKISLFQFFYDNLLLNSAHAQNSRAEFNVVSTDTVTELDRLDSLMRASRMYKKAASENIAPTAKAISIENSEAFVKRMNQVKNNLKTAADFKIYNDLKNEFANDFPAQAQKIAASKTPSQTSTQIAAQTEKSAVAKKSEKITDAAVTKSVGSSKESPFCIYAGFIIYGEKCSPNKKLPDSFNLAELRKDMFKCDNESEILCNPLLFGYKKNCFKVESNEVCSEKPICISRSVNATKNCSELTNSKDSFEQILSLWKNPKNKITYEKYIKDMNQLCNADNFTAEDVKQTCKVSAKRFNLIMDQNFPARVDVKIKTADPVKTNQ